MIIITNRILISWINKAGSRKDIDQVVRKMGSDPKLFSRLLHIVEKDEPEISGKASWIARAWAEKNILYARKKLDLILRIIQNTKEDPIARNLTGLIVSTGFPENYEGVIADTCFDLLKQQTRAVAVHSNALTLLSGICKKYPELLFEIKLITENHFWSDMPAFKAALRKFKFKKR